MTEVTPVSVETMVCLCQLFVTCLLLLSNCCCCIGWKGNQYVAVVLML